jgi:hypothetical protein
MFYNASVPDKTASFSSEDLGLDIIEHVNG